MGWVDHRAIVGYPPMRRTHRLNPESWIVPDVAPSAMVEAFAVVENGTERPTRVGPESWLMIGSIVGHDATIGRGCEVGDYAVIGGFCELGDNVRLGIGAVIIKRAKIGDGAVIGAGAVVTKDVPAGETWAGVPARKLDKGEWPEVNTALPPGYQEWWYQEWGSWWDRTRAA